MFFQAKSSLKSSLMKWLSLKQEDGKPVFEDLRCPFLQACVVYLIWLDGKCTRIIWNQNDYSCCLYSVTDNCLPSQVEIVPQSIYRIREIKNFPMGEISSIVLQFDVYNGVLLKTSEVYEDGNDKLLITENDESILVFLNSADKDRVVFGAQNSH